MRDQGLVCPHQIKRSTHQEQGAERKMNTNRIENNKSQILTRWCIWAGYVDACGAELIFASQDKNLPAASGLHPCKNSNSFAAPTILCCFSDAAVVRGGESWSGGEGEEDDQPPLDFLSKAEKEERECPCPVVGQCEWELCLLPASPPSPRSSLLPNSQSSSSGFFF
jgi:hypothetical protein